MRCRPNIRGRAGSFQHFFWKLTEEREQSLIPKICNLDNNVGTMGRLDGKGKNVVSLGSWKNIR